eukprot:8295415-Alexandrium_andersonii.AAC.1
MAAISHWIAWDQARCPLASILDTLPARASSRRACLRATHRLRRACDGCASPVARPPTATRRMHVRPWP